MSDFINAKLESGSSSDSELMLFFYSQCYLLFVGYVQSDAQMVVSWMAAFRQLLLGLLLLKWLLLTYSLLKTPLGETGCLGNPYFLLTGCLTIQLFDSPPFLNTVSQVTFRYLPLPVQHLCYLRDAMTFKVPYRFQVIRTGFEKHQVMRIQ